VKPVKLRLVKNQGKAPANKKHPVQAETKVKKANISGKIKHPKTTSRKRLAF
jgi:hypothetical protein